MNNLIIRKPVYLWYSHAHIPLDLKLANYLVKRIFTASNDSLLLPSNKKCVIGHGIYETFLENENQALIKKSSVKLVSIGRITPQKNYLPLIKAVGKLKQQGIEVQCDLIGPTLLDSDIIYKAWLEDEIAQLDLEQEIHFLPELAYSEVGERLKNYDIFINLQPLGGMGKAVLESMGMGLITLFCTDAYDNQLPTSVLNYLKFNTDDHIDLANKIQELTQLNTDTQKFLKKRLRSYTLSHHSLNELWAKISHFINSDCIRTT